MAERETSGPGRDGEHETHIIATPQALVITLSEEHRRAARQCMETSGRITFSMEEVSVTKLPELRLGDGVIVD